jgi:protoporphyrinogen oxidase
MARIASYGNFSPEMLANPSKSALSVEYFTFAHEDLWQMSDGELIALAAKELCHVGLLKSGDVEDGFVLREKDAYPTYYVTYRQHLEIIKDYVSQFKNVTLIGRGGMYRYNNQDHSILCGLLAAKNYVGGRYDLWEINEEQEYHEEKQLPVPMHAGASRL